GQAQDEGQAIQHGAVSFLGLTTPVRAPAASRVSRGACSHEPCPASNAARPAWSPRACCARPSGTGRDADDRASPRSVPGPAFCVSTTVMETTNRGFPMSRRLTPPLLLAGALCGAACGTQTDKLFCGTASCEYSANEWETITSLAGLPESPPPD